MLSNGELNPVVTELFLRVRKLNVSLVFITQSTHCFIMKISNKGELQQIAFSHSSDIDFKDFMNLYKKYHKTIFFFTELYYSCIR